MDSKKGENTAVNTIHIKAPSDREFFLIHGYTGSPTDFNGLAETLHAAFNANVHIVLLKGHGTRIEDLNGLRYEDFLSQLENELIRDLDSGKKIIIGGLSFGGQLALSLAARHPVRGVINVVTPYKWKFPFTIPGIGVLGYFKKYWSKWLSKRERRMRQGAFFYSHMPSYGFVLAKHANADLDEVLGNIQCPCLTIHARGDSIGDHRSIQKIEAKIASRIKEHLLLLDAGRIHSVFYSAGKDRIVSTIIDFVNRNEIFTH